MKTEPELIQHILAGEWRNYAILVDKYQKKVFNYVNYLMGNREDAEEVTQDTFTKAYRSLGQFRGDAKFSTWLLRIAHFESLTRLRKKKPMETGIDHVVCFSENAIDNPQYMLQQRDKAKVLNLALNKLTPDERSVITLFYYEDLSIKEIVEVTKLKESNVKIHLHRGRKKLFGILSKMGIKEITYE
ncbi:MAG: sigma-70 family RNA polymerase sigma factor [Bacteroidota bacterium]